MWSGDPESLLNVTKMTHLLACSPMRRLVAMSISLCALFPMGSDSRVIAADSDAQQAAEEIADARERANQATDAYFEAESVLDALEVEAQRLEIEITAIEHLVAELRERVRQVAVNRFTRSSSGGSPLLNGFANAEEQMQVAVFTEVINDTSAEDFDEFDSLNRDLARKNDELAAKHSDTEAQRANAIALRDQAIAEVENLKDVEAERLKDEAVRKALAAEERTRAAEAAREEAARQAAPTTTIAFEDIDAPSDLPVNPAIAAEVGSGGQTGGGGAGGRPSGAGDADYAQAGWVCPTGSAAVGFGDTWGAPRSGGRHHQGVDMIGARGTPILAVVDGFAESAEGLLGGLTVRLVGVDGNRYFYGHFDSYGQLGDVKAGDILGLMGDTGNANGTPHLHFEIHPGGGAAVNPYPTVRAHC